MDDFGRFIVPGSVTLVIAPRGYGKSELLRRWRRERRDDGERVVRMGGGAPDRGRPADATGAAEDGIPHLVFDDVDPTDAEHRDLVSRALAAQEAGAVGTILLASRDSALADLAADADPDVFPSGRLLLADDEIRRLAARRGVSLGIARLACLRELADGVAWPTVLALDVIAENPALTDAETTAVVLGRMAAELDGLQLRPEGRLVLTGDRWDVPTAALLVGEEARGLLRAAEAAGLLRLSSATGYASVGVYARALGTLPHTERSAGTLREWRYRLLEELIARERFTEAADAALLIDESAAAYRVAVEATQAMSFSTHDVLTRALQSRPYSWFEGDPNVAAMVGLVGRGGLYSHLEWQLILSEFVRRERTTTTTVIDRLVDQWVHGLVLRLRGNLPAARDQVARSIATWETMRNDGRSSHGVAASALHSGSITMTLSERYADAETTAVESVRLARIEQRAQGVFVHAGWLAASRALAGDIHGAAQALTLVPEELRAAISPRQNHFHLIARALIALDDGDASASSAALEALRAETDRTEHWWVTHMLEARHAHLVDGAGGSILFNAALAAGARAGRTLTAPDLVVTHQVILALFEGKTGAARVHLRRAADGASARMLRAALQLAEGDAGAALDAALKEGACEAPWQDVLRLLVGAASALRSGSPGLGADLLGHAVENLRERGAGWPLRLLSSADHTVLREAAEGLGSHVRSVLDEAMRRHPGSSGALTGIRLTRSEERVLQAIRVSSSTDETAAALDLSRNTVKTQLRSLYRKLGASSRAEALDRAASAGFLDMWSA